MKNLLTAIILGIALAGVSLAQTSSGEKSKVVEVKVAVVEFSPDPNASGMTAEAKRQLQASIASALAKTDKLDLADVRWTRTESQDNLTDINGGSSIAAAVKLGKKLGVSYVLTGIVLEYTLKDADGFSRVSLKTRLIEVATGKVKHAGETTQRSTETMRSTGAAEMQAKTVKPAIEKLTATLMELKF